MCGSSYLHDEGTGVQPFTGEGIVVLEQGPRTAATRIWRWSLDYCVMKLQGYVCFSVLEPELRDAEKSEFSLAKEWHWLT